MMNESRISMAAPFLSKTYEMVDDPSTDAVVSWSCNDTCFVVWNVSEFQKLLLPKFFKHSNFSSFVRQLNTYGFRKIDPDRWEFANEGFLRGQRHLLKGIINRRKPVHAHTHPQQSSVQSHSVNSCVKIGKLGLEEIDRLKRDKNVLLQELVRLRQQQQQSTDNQLQTFGQRVQVMEQRQQQMMSFLAKAMQSPGFLAQIVHQKNNGCRHVTGVDKKRRLPNNDEENVGVGIVNRAFSDGQIVKYQPLINEAGKSMLREILKLSEPLHDRLKDPNAFLLDYVPAISNAIDCGSSSTRTSGVTLSEVSQCSNQPIFPEEKVFSSNHAMNSNVHSSLPTRRCPAKEVQIPEGDMHRSQEDALMSDSSLVPGTLSQGSFDMSISRTQNSDLGFMDALSAVQNGTLPFEGEVYSPGRLPVSVDNFWEQFFNILPENTEEVNSSTPEASLVQELELGPPEEWKNHHPMNHITEQMGLLTAVTERV